MDDDNDDFAILDARGGHDTVGVDSDTDVEEVPALVRAVQAEPAAASRTAKGGKRNRNWCFTSYAVTAPTYDEDYMDYLIYQREKCPDTGREHWQGTVKMKNPTGLKRVQELLKIGNSHCEIVGNWKKSVDYCRKPETRLAGPFEYGEDKGQGRRSDLDGVVRHVEMGLTVKEIGLLCPHEFIKYARGIERLVELKQEQKTNVERKCVLIWGDSGSGKTRWVKEQFPNVYDVFDARTPWFDGYMGQDIVLFDDVGLGAICNRNYFKKLTDIYGFTVPIKGGSVTWQPKMVFLTANSPWTDWWKDLSIADHEAIKRRIKSIYTGDPDWKKQIMDHLYGKPDTAVRPGSPGVQATVVDDESDAESCRGV